jgi:endonuclease/exonuclease/phosphatase family metal-dependent hydrolase
LAAVLRDVQPDLLCVQEALPGQVQYLERLLPNHHRVGVGRDNGRSSGEHCAIFFNRDRFLERGGGTFWLEEPTGSPQTSWRVQGPKRICTWVRLDDRRGGRFVRVYNAHSYLSESARLGASRIIIDHINAGDPADAVLLTGDFNAGPDSLSRQVFSTAGLKSTSERQTNSTAAPTIHFYGIRLASIDDILINANWSTKSRAILDQKPANTFPSDHFGVIADLELIR